MYQRFFIFFLLFFSLLALPLIPNYFFLKNNREFYSVDQVAILQNQSDHFSLYGPALTENLYEYKLDLYKIRKPDVVALGSSRVMQFRERFFNTSFVNLGMPTLGMRDILFTLENTLAIHKPKMVILGLDFWWFSARSQTHRASHMRDESERIFFDFLTEPYKWLFKKRISFREYGIGLKPYTGDHIGVRAVQKQDGFGPDGSEYSLSIITGMSASPDQHFSKTKRDLTLNMSTPVDFGVSASELDLLHQVIKLLEDNNIDFVIFVPPVAPSIVEYIPLDNLNYRYIQQLFKHLSSIDQHSHGDLSSTTYQIYNYHDPRLLPSDDCEFIDGLHGGDLVYAKVLGNIAFKNKEFKPYINNAYIQKVTLEHHHCAMLRDHAQFDSIHEVDFLKLDCQKHVI